jgi:Fe-S cluster assembly protein SufD
MSAVLSEVNQSTSVISSALTQYIGSVSSLKQLREDALIQFQRLGLPAAKSEEYKHTPITRILEKNFSLGANNASSPGVDPTRYFIPEVTGSILVFINGIFSPAHSVLPEAGKLTVQPLSKAVQEAREGLDEYLGKIADYSTDAFAAWNTAAWTDGVFVHVPANTVVEDPILIYHIHDVQAGQVISAARNLVIVGRSSEVTILEKFDSIGNGNGFSTVVSEAVIAENGALNWYSIQNDSGNRYQFDLKQIKQANSSRVNTYTFTLDGKLVRNNLQLLLDGEGIDSHMYGLYLVGKDTLADNHTVVDHRQPNSFSNELYKGIVEDSAKGVFNGKIFVRPHAQKTNAFQANKNILLSDKASVNTKPQLEIWADDVKCSHGCTSGQLDEEALFYLQARGIGKDTARAMMLYAFAGELLENIKNPSLKTYIDGLISERLHKNF